MRVPTVRVVNPANPASFMTINAADHRAEHHDLWPDQGEGFDPADLLRPAPIQSLDPAVRDAAAALCLRGVSFQRAREGKPFVELAAAEQLAVLNEAGASFDRAIAEIEDDQRRRDAFENQRPPDPAVQAEIVRGRADQEADEDGLSPCVAKGPGGRWYIHRGERRVSKGFATEAEAIAEMTRPDEARAA